jgi:Uma2 family endonuclease
VAGIVADRDRAARRWGLNACATGYPLDVGARTATSIERYLHTSFPDIDREYRDGQVVGRSMPDYLHGKTQALLVAFFTALRKTLPVFACVETRMKIRTGLYLIPDVAVFYPVEPPLVPDAPPLVAIEVLSVDDRLTAVREKLEEYRAWGVKHSWLVDPHQRRMFACDGGLIEVGSLRIPELEIELTRDAIFE